MQAWPVLVALAMVLLGGCGGNESALDPRVSPSPSTVSAATLAREYGLHLWPESQTGVVPETLNELPWSSYQAACLESGFDLRPYSGREAVFTAYRLRDRREGLFATLHTISVDDRIVGSFVTIPGEIPGIYSLAEAESWQ